MEGHFNTGDRAPLVIVGQPNMETLRLDNPIELPGLLSYLTHANVHATIIGLKDFPRDEWPDNVPLLYYSYHIMVGLGTIMMAIATIALLALLTRRLHRHRWLLWVLMLMFPFPFIANTAGWMTAEIGRQPWIIHGLLRTAHGHSANVSSGNVMFTLLGFMGLYAVFSVVYLYLVGRVIAQGPEPAAPEGA
jgi:cytochrome d ubiquinol oxidase subunit I